MDSKKQLKNVCPEKEFKNVVSWQNFDKITLPGAIVSRLKTTRMHLKRVHLFNHPLVVICALLNESRSPSLYKIHINKPFVLGLYLTAMNTGEFIFYQFVSTATDIYFSNFSAAFHPGGSINSITPNIIGEFFDPYYAGNNRACVNAETQFKKGLPLFFAFPFIVLNKLYHLQPGRHHVIGMCFIRHRQAADTHIRIPYGLYFSMPCLVIM